MGKDLKWLEVIITFLEEKQQSMHYTEIAQTIIGRGYRNSVSEHLQVQFQHKLVLK